MDSKKKKKSGYKFRVAKKLKELQKSANSSKKITHFYTNNIVEESCETFSENPELDDRDEINEIQTEKLEIAGQEKGYEITTNEIKVKESNEEFLKCRNQEATFNENLKNVMVETIEIRQEHQQDITGKIVQKLYANEKIDEVINYFCKPKSIDIVNFFIFHPIQPTSSSIISLPFNEKIFYNDQGDCKFNRKWLTYDENNQMLFCSVCLAYSNGSSTFCSGFNDWKHTNQRIKEHEISKHHNLSVKAYIREKREKTVQHLLCGEQLKKRKIEVNERRCVVLQIIEVIKLIGKQGLPFRGNKSEAAYKLDDSSINHGNFLEIILLLSKSDNILKSHIEKSIKLSKEHHDRAQNINMKLLKTTTKIGRGNLVTFLIKKAKIFSVMMDTTMDLSSYDQCSIVLRYVPHNEVYERLIGLKHVTSTSGNSLFETLKDTLAELDLPLNNCVANAFDGAANMSGQYNGVTAKLSEVIANHVHTWCYAHVLNLVLSDTTQCLTPCMSFFNLIQESYVFFKESYKRLAVYNKENPSLKLAASVATRWRSRNDAIVKIFGRIDFWIKGDLSTENESKFVYIQILVALYEISISNQFNSKIRNDSLSLMKKFCSYETVLVTMMFLQIFKITTPLSDYLQTKNLDYIQAWRHVSSAHKSLQSVRNRFCDIIKAAKTFVDFAIKKIDEKELHDIEIEEKLSKKRKRTVKRMDGELTRDEEVYPEEIDQFHHQILYRDLECFDPQRFDDIRKNSLSSNALIKICELLPSIDQPKLKEELISFATSWPLICKVSLQSTYEDSGQIDTVDDDELDSWSDLKCSEVKECNVCLSCALRVITDFNMYSLQYTELYKAYKYLLTLPLTQVTCERSFSKLKLLKTRLRSTIVQDNLESLFLMQCERDIVNQVDGDKIINALCLNSKEMQRLLT
ncbi:zinc finger MYM-type protein 1-like [Melanaphis sacchari]|uniref:zinc finger MYM-type protein 1-like n=1 Tax=Melanaphis sacchari TaxID=742174 RepID=UPI000DC13CB9|nr:zinc finger MYM-type protein 1-like [Melanaphis sacchari]